MSLLDQLSSLCNNANLIHHSNFFDFTENYQKLEVDDKIRHRSMTTTPIKIKNIDNEYYNGDNQDGKSLLFKNVISHCATERKQPMHSEIDKRIRNLKKMSFFMAGKIRKIYYQFFIKLQKITNQKNLQKQKQKPLPKQTFSQVKQKIEPFNNIITINTSNLIIQNGQENQNFKKKQRKNLIQKDSKIILQKFIDTLSILYSKAIQTNQEDIKQKNNKFFTYFGKIKRYSVFIKFFQRIQSFYNINCLKNAFCKIGSRFKTSVKVDILASSLRCLISNELFQLKRVAFQKIVSFKTGKIHLKMKETSIPLQKLELTKKIQQSNPLIMKHKQLKSLLLFKPLQKAISFYDCQNQRKGEYDECNRFRIQNIPAKLNRFLPCDEVNIVNDVPDNGHLLINEVRLNNYFGTHFKVNSQNHIKLIEDEDSNKKCDHCRDNVLDASNLRIQKIHINSNDFNNNKNTNNPCQLQTIRKSLKITSNNMIKDIKKNGTLNKPRSSISTQRKECDIIIDNNNEYLHAFQNEQNFLQTQKQYRTCTQGVPKVQKVKNNNENIIIDQTNSYRSPNYNHKQIYSKRIQDDILINGYQKQKKSLSINTNTYNYKKVVPVKFKLNSQSQQIKNTKTQEHKKILDKILAQLNAQYLQKSGKKQSKQIDHVKTTNFNNLNCNELIYEDMIKQVSNTNCQIDSKKKINFKICLKESLAGNSSSKKKMKSNKDKNQISSIKKLQLQSHSKYSNSNSKSNQKQKDFFIELKLNKKQKQFQNPSAKKEQKELKIQSNISKIKKFLIEQKPTVVQQNNRLNKNNTNRTEKCTRQSFKNKKNKALNVSLKNQIQNSFALQQYGSTNFLPNFDDIEINFGQLQEINCSILKKPNPLQYQSQKPPSRQSVQYIQSLLQTMRSNKHTQAEDFSSNYHFACQPSKNQNSYSNITYFSNKPHNNTRTEMNSKKVSMQSSKIELNGKEMKKIKKQQNSELIGQQEDKNYIKGRYSSVTPPASTTTAIRLSMKRNSFNKQKEGWEDMFQKQKSKFLNLTKCAKENQKKSMKCSHNEINTSKISKDSSINKIKPRKSFISTTSNLANDKQSLANAKVNLYKQKSILTSKNSNIQNI